MSVGKSYKVVLVGNTNVGKSCIFNRIIKNIYNPEQEATVGYDKGVYRNKDISDNYLTLIDTAGQEKYDSLLSNYFRDSSATIIVYSIENPDSLKKIEEKYSGIIKEYQIKIVFLVENKIDLRDEPDYPEDLLPQESGINLAEKLGYHFESVSAKDGTNIENLAKGILSNCDNLDLREEQEVIKLEKKTEDDGKDKKCC